MLVVLYIYQCSEYLITVIVQEENRLLKYYFIMFITMRNPSMTSNNYTKQHFKRNK